MEEGPSRSKKQTSDYYNSILLKMTPKLSKLELTIISIMDGICKGNKKKGTCCLSIQQLAEAVSYRMPDHSVNQEWVKTVRSKLQKRGLLIQVGTWERKKVFTTVIPRAEAEGFKGLQIPLEAATDPSLSQAAKLIFGRLHYLLTVNDGQRIYLDWTDARLSDDLNIGLPQTKQAISQLKTRNYLVIRNGKSRYRQLGLHPEWDLLNKSFLPQFEQKPEISKGQEMIAVKSMKGQEMIAVKSIKAVSGKDLPGPNKYLKDNKYDFLSENQAEQSSAKGDFEMSVYQTRAVDRVLAYWNKQDPPLQKSGPKVIRRAVPVIKNILLKYSESTIEKCIALYHQSLHNPTLMCQKMNKRSPYRISVEEFFGFSLDSKIFIQQNKIKGFESIDSWFSLCLKGESEIANRFTLVPADKYPIITKMLRQTISSWDDHPPIVGSIAEKQLRKASVKLVEFHQRIKSRITDHRVLMKISTPAFLQEHLIPYILENLDLEKFQIYWLMSDNFICNFERHLEEMRALSRPPLVRHRREWDSDKGISFGSGGGATYRHRNDRECELSPTDFENI